MMEPASAHIGLTRHRLISKIVDDGYAHFGFTETAPGKLPLFRAGTVIAQ